MKTALDSSVILDVVANDPQWADASERAIKEAYSLGQLVVCECVIAEITPAFALGDLETFLLAWKIRHIPFTLESAAAAGEMYRSYLLRGVAAKRVIPDFLIGSHAMHHADRLLARDRGYYRDYFTNLKVIEPA
jgi:predicted nucleic acid-binding protein